ncbi:MAG: hypothetical protein FWC34_08955 [Bacteroidetes bacterium]|nr:hypothetical protein [Bacteroidota bacterium]
MSNFKAYIIILHYDKDTSNHIMGERLKKALLEGNITPRDYAHIIDRHLDNAGNPQLYHSIPFFMLKPLTEEEREIVNYNRESIGLKKLNEIVVIKRGKNLIVKHK